MRLSARPWSVYRWIEGEPGASARIDDLDVFAADLARFLRALGRVDASGGPAAGDHSFGRGGPLERYDAETRAAIGTLGGRIDGRAALRAWESALDQPWTRPPVWLHGDVAASNLLVRDGRLAAVIDFGCCAVGDPACDTVMAWTFFTGTAATTFLETLDLDRGTRARGPCVGTLEGAHHRSPGSGRRGGARRGRTPGLAGGWRPWS